MVLKSFRRKKIIGKKGLKEKISFIMDSISAYVAYINAKTLRYEFVNHEFTKAFNISREKIIGKHMKEILPDKNYQNAINFIEAVRNGNTVTYEYYFDVSIGKRWIKVDYIPEFDIAGKVVSFIVLGTDITDRKIAEEKMKKSEAMYRFIVETANEGILIFNASLEIIFVNNKLASMLGYETKELLGKSFKDLLFEEHFSKLEVQLEKRRNGEDEIYERYLKRKDGSKHWVIVSAKAMMDDQGQYTGSFAMFTDIHARKLMEEQLENAIKKLEILSNLDGLTNLANRRYFDEMMFLEYERLSRSKLELSFIMIDIDYFKRFNDLYGHLCGDNCLRKVAKVLSDSISGSANLIARYGGEEFICMLPETNMEGAVIFAEKMRIEVENLQIPHAGSGISDYVTVSIGVATMQCLPGQDVLETVNNADKALYRAKSNGRNRIESYTL